MSYINLLAWTYELVWLHQTGFLALLSFHVCYHVKGNAEAVLAACCLPVSGTQAVWLVQLVEANSPCKIEVKQTCLTGLCVGTLWVGIIKTKYTKQPHSNSIVFTQATLPYCLLSLESFQHLWLAWEA